MADSLLLRDPKATKALSSQREEAFVSLLRSADLLRWRASEVLGPEGITLAQFNVLLILRAARDTGLPTLSIGARLMEQAPGITRLIDRLEFGGLVRRERPRADRRQVRCHIEKRGLALLARVEGALASSTDAMFAGLSSPDLDRLLSSLETIRATCVSHCISLRKK